MFATIADTEIASVVRLTDEVLNAKAVPDTPGAVVLHIDLGRVRLPTAEGLGALLRLNAELRRRDGCLILLNVPADVYDVFEETGLTTVLDVRPLASG